LLRQLRGSRTQMEVAVKAAISRSYLSELENGKYGGRIPRYTLEALAEALGVAPGVLFAMVGAPVDAVDVSEPRPDFVAFVLSEPTLSEIGRAAILAVYRLAVGDPDPQGPLKLIERPGQGGDLVADPGREKTGPGSGEGFRSALDHGEDGLLEGVEAVADDGEVDEGPLG